MNRTMRAGILVFLGWTARAADPFDVVVEGSAGGESLLIEGNYTPPRSPKDPVLVLIHGLGSTRDEWAPLVRRAAARGWGAVAYDLRGHGRSRTTLAGKTIDHESPKYGRNAAFWKMLPGDLERVLASLEKKTGVPKNEIVLVGASLGANVALDVASRVKGIRALVLLSPGLEYAGIGAETPLATLETRTLLIAAEPDLYSYTSCERLKTLAAPGVLTWKPLVMGTSRGAHGTQLFDGRLEDQILDWAAHKPRKPSHAPAGTPKK